MSPSASNSGNEQPRIKKSSTCTNCRERHLKCDGAPECSRCRLEKTPCVYVASRRGQRKPSSNVRRHDAVGGLSRDGSRGPNTTIWTTPIVSGGRSARLIHPEDSSSATAWGWQIPTLSWMNVFLLTAFSCRSSSRLFCHCGRGETSTECDSITLSCPET